MAPSRMPKATNDIDPTTNEATGRNAFQPVCSWRVFHRVPYRTSTAAPDDELFGLDAVVGQGERTLACRLPVKRATTASTENNPAPKMRTMSEAKRNV